ncbi:hypothetical protein K432DRAFT_295952 [Lepidopterella palustris CBS 459.81]|uniref:Uncharacterized protein n=1 Tax=Lepidopterella palustris CBS 459.81 TaxID=1314670 RepID=A0A8E2ECJ3_9PEZI|nr:hypothetical protein K432DRAFT_295952 [Lepidopterella palustris CBS 459.81]
MTRFYKVHTKELFRINNRPAPLRPNSPYQHILTRRFTGNNALIYAVPEIY